uniref:Uncharacterized protein n=1 Tax=viral metagenome TaxID=1070528 RepID=A0A6M3LVE7_9ZZZZ
MKNNKNKYKWAVCWEFEGEKKQAHFKTEKDAQDAVSFISSEFNMSGLKIEKIKGGN